MYAKSGEPRTIAIPDLVLQGFVGAVPLFKAPGDPEVPDMIYLLANPKGCMVQAYQKAPY